MQLPPMPPSVSVTQYTNAIYPHFFLVAHSPHSSDDLTVLVAFSHFIRCMHAACSKRIWREKRWQCLYTANVLSGSWDAVSICVNTRMLANAFFICVCRERVMLGPEHYLVRLHIEREKIFIFALSFEETIFFFRQDETCISSKKRRNETPKYSVWGREKKEEETNAGKIKWAADIVWYLLITEPMNAMT